MSIWQGERNSNQQQLDAHQAYDLRGGESYSWAELQAPAGSRLIDMKGVLNHVYAYATPAHNSPEPNTLLVLAAGALGVLALRRSRQCGREGVRTND